MILRKPTFLVIVLAMGVFAIEAKEWACTKYPKLPTLIEAIGDDDGLRLLAYDKALRGVEIYEHPFKGAKVIDHLKKCETIEEFKPYLMLKKLGSVKVVSPGELFDSFRVKAGDVLPLIQNSAMWNLLLCIGHHEALGLDAEEVSSGGDSSRPAMVKILRRHEAEHWIKLKTPRGKEGYAIDDYNLDPAPRFFVNTGTHATAKLCPGDLLAPPKIFVDKDACPFECCTYRNWFAEENIPIFSDLTKHKQVGIIQKGEIVSALTGEVHTVPAPARIVYDHGQYKVGDQLYLLTSLGEGFFRTWFKGHFSGEEIPSVIAYGEDPFCKTPSADCWARLEVDKIKEVWWVKIQRKDGTTGWTDVPDSFGNKDACG